VGRVSCGLSSGATHDGQDEDRDDSDGDGDGDGDDERAAITTTGTPGWAMTLTASRPFWSAHEGEVPLLSPFSGNHPHFGHSIRHPVMMDDDTRAAKQRSRDNKTRAQRSC
jgi:hypothetical protein